MEEVKCNICNKKTNTTVWAKGNSKRHYNDKRDYTIVKCRECGLIYTNPRLTKEELSEYYGKTYVDNRGKETLKNAKRQKMYEIEVKQIKDVLRQEFGNKKISFLDVGASTGAFLIALNGKNIEKYATEITEDASKVAKKNAKPKKIWIGDITDIDFENYKFDVVHLRAIFEHVLEPKNVLKKIKNILTDNGILILSTTPNVGSPAARLYKYRWTLTKPEEHTYYYTNRTINKLFEMTGFERFKTEYPYKGTPYYSPLKDHLHFILNYFTGKESPSFWRSAFTIYARKKH